MLLPEEKIAVQYYHAYTEEDTYENGCVPDSCGTSWSHLNIPVSGLYDTVDEALNAVCEANGFSFNPEWWDDDGLHDERGRFYTDVLVDIENFEADEDDIAEWKAGRLRLWICRIFVKLVVSRSPRELAEDEARISTNNR